MPPRKVYLLDDEDWRQQHLPALLEALSEQGVDAIDGWMHAGTTHESARYSPGQLVEALKDPEGLWLLDITLPANTQNSSGLRITDVCVQLGDQLFQSFADRQTEINDKLREINVGPLSGENEALAATVLAACLVLKRDVFVASQWDNDDGVRHAQGLREIGLRTRGLSFPRRSDDRHGIIRVCAVEVATSLDQAGETLRVPFLEFSRHVQEFWARTFSEGLHELTDWTEPAWRSHRDQFQQAVETPLRELLTIPRMPESRWKACAWPVVLANGVYKTRQPADKCPVDAVLLPFANGHEFLLKSARATEAFVSHSVCFCGSRPWKSLRAIQYFARRKWCVSAVSSFAEVQDTARWTVTLKRSNDDEGEAARIGEAVLQAQQGDFTSENNFRNAIGLLHSEGVTVSTRSEGAFTAVAVAFPASVFPPIYARLC